MDRASLAVALDVDQLGIDRDMLAPFIASVFSLGVLDDALGFGITRLEQIFLTSDGVLEFAGTPDPLLA